MRGTGRRHRHGPERAIRADGRRQDAGITTAGGRVRAAYGHSVDVTLDGTDDPVPATLYHGTARGTSIRYVRRD